MTSAERAGRPLLNDLDFARPYWAAVSKNELGPEYIIPSVFHTSVFKNVAKEVAHAAVRTGVAEEKRTATSMFL